MIYPDMVLFNSRVLFMLYQKVRRIVIRFEARVDNRKYGFSGRDKMSSELETFKGIYIYEILLTPFRYL